jgi:hypothetical protein
MFREWLATMNRQQATLTKETITMNNVTFPRCNRFAFRLFCTFVLAGGLIVALADAANAAPVAPEYRVPGHCVTTTEINDDGTIVKRESCEFTAKDAACIKATGKVCKR